MELIGMILATAPGTTNIHKQRAVSVETNPIFNGSLSPFFDFATLQHGPCNKLTVHVWSQTDAQKQLVC